MKQITMDFETYKQEESHTFSRGYKKGFEESRRIVMYLLAGEPAEKLMADFDDELEIKFIEKVAEHLKRLKR